MLHTHHNHAPSPNTSFANASTSNAAPCLQNWRMQSHLLLLTCPRALERWIVWCTNSIRAEVVSSSADSPPTPAHPEETALRSSRADMMASDSSPRESIRVENRALRAWTGASSSASTNTYILNSSSCGRFAEKVRNEKQNTHFM